MANRTRKTRFMDGFRRTKIVATIGPASADKLTLRQLVDAGVDVMRLNFSHGNHEEKAALITSIREVEVEAGRPIAILQDIQGPKIRVGAIRDAPLRLEPGDILDIHGDGREGEPGHISTNYPNLVYETDPGESIFLDDGMIELRVTEEYDSTVRCEVIVGGDLHPGKGVNLPGARLSVDALTEKDCEDLRFGMEHGVDYVALSFVRHAYDAASAREVMVRVGPAVPLLAKVEKREAVDRMNSILRAFDGAMVARGDLGVELPPEQVPIAQSQLVDVARRAGKPVIVATQMLESMIQAPRPTRAEVTDVADAAHSLADAVMLSAETAVGRYPREAVATMDRILRLVEGHQWKHGKHGLVSERAPEGGIDAPAAMARAVAQLSRDVAVRSIVVPTEHGNTARQIAAKRPAAPIIAVSADERVCRRLALYWGVTSQLAPPERQADLPRLARDVVRRLGLAESGQPILLVWDSDPAHTGAALSVSLLSA